MRVVAYFVKQAGGPDQYRPSQNILLISFVVLDPSPSPVSSVPTSRARPVLPEPSVASQLPCLQLQDEFRGHEFRGFRVLSLGCRIKGLRSRV